MSVIMDATALDAFMAREFPQVATSLSGGRAGFRSLSLIAGD